MERLHAEPKDKADILNRQYESMWTKEDKSCIPSPDGTPFPPVSEGDQGYQWRSGETSAKAKPE